MSDDSMETISSSSSEQESLLMPGNEEISPLFSEAKTSSLKRRLEEDEDSTIEQDSGEAIAGTSVGSSVLVGSGAAPPLSKATNKKRRLEENIPTEQVSGTTIAETFLGSVLADISPEDQERELVPRKVLHLDNESSRLASSSEVVADDTGDSSISSIPAAAPATSIIVPLVSPPTSTLASHVQVSATVADPPAEISSEDTAPDPVVTSPPLTEAQIKELDTDHRPLKKPRLDFESSATNPVTSSTTLGSTDLLAVAIPDANTDLQTNCLAKSSSFVVLPVELLSEILIHTGSPQHVLAVARTCKALCQTLLSSNNQFIWKMARRACVFDGDGGPMSLPDPPKDFFGEAAYAAFVFDSGACDVCGKDTKMMYTSFALRVRLCKDLQCRNSACSFLGLMRAPYRRFTEVIPFTESHACLMKFPPQAQLTYYPHIQEYCRASDFQNAMTLVKNAPQDEASLKKYEAIRSRNIKWMQFTVSVHKWSRARQLQFYTIRSFNESQSRKFADKFGWDRSDMINSTVYGDYLKQNNKVLVKVDETDVRVMVDRIESQLLALSERRDRHAAEVASLRNRSDVAKYYNMIQSGKMFPVLPSLPTFRHLPIIKLLQSAPATDGVTIVQTLASNSLMRGLLSDQLKQWVEKAKDDFAVLLGLPKKWKNASKNVVHPVERATARFRCIRCDAKAKGGSKTDDGSLDFESACKHVCSVGQGRIVKGKKGKWDVSNFVKDEKAIQALNKVIHALGYSEDKDGARTMISLGLAVLCTSCNPPMILDSRSVVGHCHRHDAMELSLTFSVETVTSYLGEYPFTFGLAEKLLGPDKLTFKGKKAIGNKNYGCRHCLREKQVGPQAAAVPAENSDGGVAVGEETGETNEPPEAIQIQLSTIVCRMHDRGIQGPKERPPPLFNFDGLRSHLKAKHGIEGIRDEDILCYDAVETWA